MRAAFEELDMAVGGYRRATLALGEQQQDYLAQHGTYLSGLHKHVLGSDPKESAIGSRIFKKCAYVADAIYRNRTVAI